MPRRTFVLRRAGLAVLLLLAQSAHAAHTSAPGATPYPNTTGFGVDFDSGEDWHRLCMRVAHLAPARTGTPGPGTQRSGALDLYDLRRDQAATTAQEWRQVRPHALAAGDAAVLMMLYANGYGVVRDTDRAIYHACRLETAKAEMEARVAHLASSTALEDPFDLCDHITSSSMGAVCAGLNETRADRTRTARLERFAAALPAPARAPFARLRQAAAASTQQSASEVDMTGTASAGVAIHRVGRRSDEFLDALSDAAQGKLERTSAAPLAQPERQLDAQLPKVLSSRSEQEGHPERFRHSTVTREDVRTTHRAWLAYRDAWGPYLAASNGRADFVSLKARLTRQRITQLGKIG